MLIMLMMSPCVSLNQFVFSQGDDGLSGSPGRPGLTGRRVRTLFLKLKNTVISVLLSAPEYKTHPLNLKRKI